MKFTSQLSTRTKRARSWLAGRTLGLIRQFRVSYMPPLMVYAAAGISGLTGIVGTFFIKDYLNLPAEFLAMLGFWVGLPWALKMPMGHLVDLIWRWKSWLVFLGAGLISMSLAIMLALIDSPDNLTVYLSLETWFVIAALLAPVGYMIQDVVADAMTVEAVPTHVDGVAVDPKTVKSMHTTMQTLGRVAVVGGGIAVSLINVMVFSDIEQMTEGGKVAAYASIYRLAMIIPLVSILGVLLAAGLKYRDARRVRRNRVKSQDIPRVRDEVDQPVRPNWWILGGSFVYLAFTLFMGLMQVPYNQEIVFAGSMAIVLFLMGKLFRELTPAARKSLITTAVVIFVFRALPGPGAGATWWQIDELGFDQHFLSQLSLVASCLALLGMFLFRRFMVDKTIFYVIGFLTVVHTILSLPIIGMFYGLHEWTAAITNGLVDARFIALVDTALESPLGQVAMIPMLAWIANSAPAKLKATFFAVMASFTNLALSLSQLGTKYLNQIFTVSRQVLDPATGQLLVAADYTELGVLLLTVTALGLLLPTMAIMLARPNV